jgi:hypothetical protein
VNVFYTDGRVEWRPWTALRLQVMARAVPVGGTLEDHYYFY